MPWTRLSISVRNHTSGEVIRILPNDHWHKRGNSPRQVRLHVGYRHRSDMQAQNRVSGAPITVFMTPQIDDEPWKWWKFDFLKKQPQIKFFFRNRCIIVFIIHKRVCFHCVSEKLFNIHAKINAILTIVNSLFCCRNCTEIGGTAGFPRGEFSVKRVHWNRTPRSFETSWMQEEV